MKKLLISLFVCLAAVILLPNVGGDLSVSALTDGNYIYTVSNEEVTITDFGASYSGSLSIPFTLGGYPVTSIGSRAFEDCTKLTSVTIPYYVTSIGDSAFRNCSGITSVTIPDYVTSIGDSAFQNCSGLTSVTIPNSVTHIDNYVFDNCRSLTVVNIPNGVTSIGTHAFFYCSSLKSIAIPNSVTSIDYSAFSGCTNLEIVNFNAENCMYMGSTSYPVFSGCTNLKTVNIGDNVQTIPDNAFYGCGSLTSVTIGDGITTIGSNAFYDCDNLDSVYITDITAWCNIEFTFNSNPLYYANNLYVNDELANEILIPNSVKNICNFAFINCTSLTSVTIPNSVTSIGYSAFSGCKSLTSITIPDSVTSIGSSMFSGCESLANVILPDSVESIEYSAFKNCSKLTHIIIPDSITYIGHYAFESCTSLTSITIPSGVTFIGNSAFSGCARLETVNFNAENCTLVGTNTYPVFLNCTNLKNVIIGDNVQTLLSTTFYRCNAIEKITLPFVGQNADGTGFTNFGYIFGACDSSYPEYDNKKYVPTTLKEVIVTGSNSISHDAFYDCTSITRILLLGDVRIIGDSAFRDCTALKEISIPQTCQAIKTMAFYGCDNLTDVYYGGTIAQKKNIAFGYGNETLEKYSEWHFNCCIGTTEHTYDNSCDTDCNVCDDIRTINHTYTNACDTNCNICGENRDISHAYTNDCDSICNVCGVSRTITHNYEWIGDKVPTCTENGIEHEECATIGCDAVRSLGTTIPAYGHTKGQSFKENMVEPSCANLGSYDIVVYCTVCRDEISRETQTLPAKGHALVTLPAKAATYTTTGLTAGKKCSVCGTITLAQKVVPVLARTSLEKAKFTVKDVTYTGKAITQKITVKLGNKTLKAGVDYTITYKNNKNIGQATVTIAGIGAYKDSAKVTFVINPKSTSVSKLIAAKKSLKVSVKKQTKEVTGYEIQYSTSKNFKSAKKVTIKKAKTTSTTIKKLKAKKTYYVRVRTYKTVNGKKYYSSWSSYKSKKTK